MDKTIIFPQDEAVRNSRRRLREMGFRKCTPEERCAAVLRDDEAIMDEINEYAAYREAKEKRV